MWREGQDENIGRQDMTAMQIIEQDRYQHPRIGKGIKHRKNYYCPLEADNHDNVRIQLQSSHTVPLMFAESLPTIMDIGLIHCHCSP